MFPLAAWEGVGLSKASLLIELIAGSRSGVEVVDCSLEEPELIELEDLWSSASSSSSATSCKAAMISFTAFAITALSQPTNIFSFGQ